MAEYKYLLVDIDGTILDFKASEKAAIKKLFEKYGFGKCTDEQVERYSAINNKYWEALERNEITKEEVLVGRFEEFFAKEGLDVGKASEFNSDYQYALGDTIVFCDGAKEMLDRLKGSFLLAAVTNGTKTAQARKLTESGLNKVFDYIFISEEIGIEKPNKGFFDVVFDKMKITNLKEVLIIGDSLTSDILGGNNAGIDTCWYNPFNKKNSNKVKITYEINDLRRIFDIVS